MRKLLGFLVLIGGVGGLCFVGATSVARQIEATLQANAMTLALTAPHRVSARVIGRDIVVSGQVTDQTERAILQTAFEEINGARVVDMSGVETLPVADPFELRAVFGADGMSVNGAIPNVDARAALTNVVGAGDVDLVLAAGVPDDDFTMVATTTITALSALVSGEMILSGNTLNITAIAINPDASAALNVTLATLPDAYTITSDITELDDGAPLRLNVGLRDNAVDAFGKLPADLAVSEITDRFTIGENLEVAQAEIPAANPDWPDAARTGLDALSVMIEADLGIEGTAVRLAGVGSPDAIARAEALLATVPASFDVTTDLSVYGAGAELRLDMDWDGTTASTQGRYPSDFVPRDPLGGAVSDVGETLFLPDDGGAFTINTALGIEALGLLDAGSLMVTASGITLTGTAASPQIGVAVDEVLQNAATDTQIQRDITYLDDGSPAAWTLRYSATTGATIEGRLPTSVQVLDVAQTLGLPRVTGTAGTALEDDEVGSSLDTLAIAARYLPEVEALMYSRDAGGSALDLILSPGVDLDLVAVDLAETLPADVAFSLGPLEELPADGSKRVNVSTGLNEVFTQGFWLPDLDFVIDVAGCTTASNAILTSAKITFLSSSERLDATSIRAINGLAAVVRPCLDAGLTLEIGGHTDATGDAFSNDELSFDRAASVRAALMARGVSVEAITTVGYGQTEPIADNATPEGRAANRRTTLTWSTEPTPAEPEPSAAPVSNP